MHVSVSDAKAQLTDLVRRAEAGEDVVLTRRGAPTVKLIPVVTPEVRAQRRLVMEEVRAAARLRALDGGPDAARSADWLYDDNGLPT